MCLLLIPVILFILPRGYTLKSNREQVQNVPHYIKILTIVFLFIFFIKLAVIYLIFIDPIKINNYIYINTAIFSLISLVMLFWNQSIRFMNKLFADGVYKPQKLITNGPFSLVRNPIYFSYIFAFSMLVVLYPFLFLSSYYLIYIVTEILFFSTGYILIKDRITQEEQILSEFGDEYIKYKNEVPRLFPTINSFKYFMKQPFSIKINKTSNMNVSSWEN